MILYRPMDIEELRLVYEAGMRAFPPRKPEQPIFYPVLNLEYADQIARTWNAEGPSASGYVTSFNLDDTYGARFESRKVGGSHHLELWVPAEELSHFNEHILEPIAVVSAHFGQSFQGYIPARFGLQGKDGRPIRRDGANLGLQHDGFSLRDSGQSRRDFSQLRQLGAKDVLRSGRRQGRSGAGASGYSRRLVGRLSPCASAP
jgi:hypothetical protein